jgi:citrate synthase
MTAINTGLEGIVAAETRLSMVDGTAGELVIGGFPLAELAMNATFEESAWLLLTGELPDAAQLARFREELGTRRTLAPETLELLARIAESGAPAMDALRAAAGTLGIGVRHGSTPPDGIAGADWDDALSLLGAMPAIVAAYARLRDGLPPVTPDPSLGTAAGFLQMLAGELPPPARVRGLETYLNTVIDHGLNASTFTARVIVSTGSDLVSAVTGAIGALKGPLHGGAPGPALDMVFAIGSAANAEPYIRAELAAGRRLMGFGHRVYKVRDPRADVLAVAAETMFRDGGDMALYELARAVEETALRILAEHKPERRLQTNVEFYTALLLHGLGLSTDLFTPLFAVSRTAGWLAHSFEQRRANKLIRPQSVYTGPRDRKWIGAEERGHVEV